MSEGNEPAQGHSGCSAAGQMDQYEEQELRVREQAAVIRHKILVLSGKGGVGKSTVSMNLGWALALRDWRVGVLDADINGPTVPLLAGLQGEGITTLGGLDPVPVLEQLKVMSMSFLLSDPASPTIWRGPLKGGVIRRFVADVAWGELDYLVVDLPPGTGDEPLTVAQMFPEADGGIVVTTPQEASVAVCRKAVNFLRAVNLPCLGVIENMSGFVCPHCGQETAVFSAGGGERMAAEMGVPFLGRVPLAPEIVALSDQGKPLAAGGPEAIKRALEGIVDKLLQGPAGSQ